MIQHLRKGWAGSAAFKPARLVVETLQRLHLLVASKPGRA